jgi:hypothetical protein
MKKKILLRSNLNIKLFFTPAHNAQISYMKKKKKRSGGKEEKKGKIKKNDQNAIFASFK